LPDVNKHDRVKTSIEGKVDKEPGGIFPQEVAFIGKVNQKPESISKPFSSYLFDKKNTSLEMAHWSHTSFSHVGQSNQTIWQASSCNHVGWQPL
jgi:hypothetical protein